MSRALLSAGLLSLLPVSIAAAQTPCGLRTHFRIVTNMSEANNPGELRLDSGWVTARPDTLPGLITTTNPYGMESSGSCTAIADYGDLRCNGSGQAHAVSGIGAFLWLDEWLGGAPKAQYSDQVTITSATLPAGTPVDIQFTLTLAGSAEVIDTNPSVHYSALLTVNDPGSPGLRLTQGQAPGTVTGVLTTAVGHTMVPAAALNVSLQAYGILGGGTNSSYSCSLRATTTMNILTPGVTATSCSGHTYSGCGSADFNGDGDTGTDADIESFFACLAGNSARPVSAAGPTSTATEIPAPTPTSRASSESWRAGPADRFVPQVCTSRMPGSADDTTGPCGAGPDHFRACDLPSAST